MWTTLVAVIFSNRNSGYRLVLGYADESEF